MSLKVTPGVVSCVFNGQARERQRKRLTARAMPLPGQTAGDAHHGDCAGASVETDFLDMNELRSRHQGRASQASNRSTYGKGA